MKTPPEVLSIRTVDLLRMLHFQWTMGFIACALADEPADETIFIPLDGGGEETKGWYKQQFQELGKMKKRKDGTYYMPSERAKP